MPISSTTLKPRDRFRNRIRVGDWVKGPSVSGDDIIMQVKDITGPMDGYAGFVLISDGSIMWAHRSKIIDIKNPKDLLEVSPI